MIGRRLVIAAALTLGARAALSQAPAGDIFAAVRANDLATVDRLLDASPAMISARDAAGQTPLVAAAFIRRGPGFLPPEESPVFQLLARRVASPDLIEACLLKRRDIVARAIRRDPASARTASPNGRTLLHYAAYIGDVRLIDQLLAAGAPIDAPAPGAFMSRPILQAILGRRHAALDRLLARGANVGIRLDDGLTAMHEAGLQGDDYAVRALWKAGADPAAVRKNGQKPRDLAASQGFDATAALLDELATRRPG